MPHTANDVYMFQFTSLLENDSFYSIICALKLLRSVFIYMLDVRPVINDNDIIQNRFR
jgi:hypothetical protein